MQVDCQRLGRRTHGFPAEMMANAAVELGVDKRRIIQFPLARYDRRSAIFKVGIREEPFRLVTSATHMPRSVAIFTAKRFTS